jgi:pimeloyl-ACP methyl ester carboxylesterase
MQHLILLHGAIGAKDQLQPLANRLKNDFNIHLLNFSGHGGNPFPEKPFSFQLFAQDILDYMQTRNLDNAAVFGYSMGGYAAMYLAKYYPGKISKLITLATKYYWDTAVAAKEIKMLDPETIELKLPAFAKELEQRHAPQDWKKVLHHTEQLLIHLGNNNELKAADYASISIPCLLMLGDRDKMISLQETVDVYMQLSNAAFAVLPKTPHPIEKVDMELLSFFIARFLNQFT